MKETREYTPACGPSGLQRQEHGIPAGPGALAETQSRWSAGDSETIVCEELWCTTETGALTLVKASCRSGAGAR